VTFLYWIGSGLAVVIAIYLFAVLFRPEMFV
jgi:K+-transporting ATPase KdpF subunit